MDAGWIEVLLRIMRNVADPFDVGLQDNEICCLRQHLQRNGLIGEQLGELKLTERGEEYVLMLSHMELPEMD